MYNTLIISYYKKNKEYVNKNYVAILKDSGVAIPVNMFVIKDEKKYYKMCLDNLVPNISYESYKLYLSHKLGLQDLLINIETYDEFKKKK